MKFTWKHGLVLILSFPILLPVCMVMGSVIMAGVYWVGGYYVNPSVPKVVEIAVEKHDPEVCSNIRKTWYFGGFDTGDNIRGECEYRYSELALDTKGCAGLLPLDYGWSCLGNIENKLFKGVPCSYSDMRHDVYCNEKYSEGILTIENPQLTNCNAYPRKDLREWCHYRRTFEYDVFECDQITHETMNDLCEHDYAQKKRDKIFCDVIKNKARREFCIEYVGFLLKYH